ENKNPQLVIFQGYIVFGAFILARIPVSYHPQTYKQ
ncbi:putative membrane protein, partial [Parabacteroides distasonis str. 3999B T(B) 6]